MKKNTEKVTKLKGSKPSEQEKDSKQNSTSLSNLFKRIESSRKFAL